MRRGQIWLYNSNPSIGDEISKIRPCVIANNDEIGILRLKVIVPIAGWDDDFVNVSWMVQLLPTPGNGLSKISAADAFQVRSISQRRLIRQVGELSEAEMRSITQALAIVLNINE